MTCDGLVAAKQKPLGNSCQVSMTMLTKIICKASVEVIHCYNVEHYEWCLGFLLYPSFGR
jgi:hypothetical protein